MSTRRFAGFFLAAFLLVSIPGQARTLAQKKELARSEYERAEQLREALNGRPAKQRTARDYDRVINAYRRVYYTAPTSNRADASALAVAELLAESARAFHNIKGFHASIEQYEFLRREYPGSKYRMGALFSIGQIYRDDLLDYDKAQAAFADFLKHYPGNHLADQARSAIAEMEAEIYAAKAKANGAETARNTSTPEVASNKDPFHTSRPAQTPEQEQRRLLTPVASTTASPRKHGQLALVTGIRHWSTPDYTRVAIDIDDEVQYEAGRVPSPDRIFFDLNSTHLAPELAGKSFDVGDGFLRKVRIAQFKSNMTRVVLEVDQVADYSAFLLPNPYRLIIDIHGKQPATASAAKKKTPETRTTPTPSEAAAQTAGQTTTVASVSHESRAQEKENTGANANASANNTERKDRTTTHTTGSPAASHEGSSQNSGSQTAGAAHTENMTSTSGTQVAEKLEHSSERSSNERSSNERSANERSADQRSSDTRSSDKSSVNEGSSNTPDTEIADNATTAASNSNSKDSSSSSRNASSKETASQDSSDDLSMSEIADLNQQPDEVKATDRPTSGPIAQSVAPRQTGSREKGDSTESETSSKITVHKTKRSGAEIAPTHEAQPTASGNRSLIRALGLKIGKIVIDAGHGGHDTGTIGPGGLQEKDLVLDVALRLGKLLQSQIGAEVVYTRSDDTFVPLETRTAIANKMQADLFISIHANSSRDPSARGIETYYLNFTASPDAMEVAARENAVSEKSVHELQDLVKKIALKEKIEESREFAADVQEGLYQGFASKAGMKNRGVKKAPFIVLIGANMPSILAEISFVSNPRDEKKLRTPEYRQKIADSLGRGVEKYIAGLSGVKLASNAGSLPSPGGN